MYDLCGPWCDSKSEVLPSPYLPLKDPAFAPGCTALQRCLDGISEGAVPGTVPGRAAGGGALRGGWDQRKFWLARGDRGAESGSSPSRFETLPTTSYGNLADR